MAKVVLSEDAIRTISQIGSQPLGTDDERPIDPSLKQKIAQVLGTDVVLDDERLRELAPVLLGRGREELLQTIAVSTDETGYNKLQAHYKRIRLVEPTEENAQRLALTYGDALLIDSELFEAICHTKARHKMPAVDGMVEPWTKDEVLAYLKSPYSLCLEVPFETDGDQRPLSFIILEHANGDPEGFANYMATKQGFSGTQQPHVGMSDRWNTALSDMQHNLYVTELVSSNRLATTALIAAIYTKAINAISTDGVDIQRVLARCLERARIGAHLNNDGNKPIKDLIGLMGMENVADITPPRERTIEIPEGDLTPFFGREYRDELAQGAQPGMKQVPVELVFGAYTCNVPDFKRGLESLGTTRRLLSLESQNSDDPLTTQP